VGNYRIPSTGPVLILANHIADIDPVVVQACCPRPIHFLAKSELFAIPVIGRLMRAFGAYPVERGKPDRAALKLAAKLLADGEVVCLFPEGQLSEDGELQEIKAGASLIVRLSPGVPVLCCGIQGTDRIIPYGKVIPRPSWKRVNVIWGETHRFEDGESSETILSWIRGQLLSLCSD
jgi:1-acyl-sn-glycerol-3-phosphate acyltransferase